MKKINVEALSVKSVYFAAGIVLLFIYSILNHSDIARPGLNAINIAFVAIAVLISVAALFLYIIQRLKGLRA